MPDIEFLFHPDAEFEFVSAFQWYWDRNSQAANAFDDAVMGRTRHSRLRWASGCLALHRCMQQKLGVGSTEPKSSVVWR